MSNYANRLMKIDAYSSFIMLTDGSFFTANYTGKIPEVIDHQRKISGSCFAMRFTIIDGFNHGKVFKVIFNYLGNFY